MIKNRLRCEKATPIKKRLASIQFKMSLGRVREALSIPWKPQHTARFVETHGSLILPEAHGRGDEEAKASMSSSQMSVRRNILRGYGKMH